MALEPKASPAAEQGPDNTASIPETKPVAEPTHSPEQQLELDPTEKKVFQAFNIKPLRQKLPTAVNLGELRWKWAEQENGGDAAKEGEQNQDTV